MPAGTLVAVDVGTHTVLAAAGRMDGGRLRILEDRQWFARLGEGVRASGLLRPEAIERALAALRGCREMAEAHGAGIVAVATRACREAANAGDFLRPAAAALGAPIEVVSGEREAELTFRGASSGLWLKGPATYVDVGGGSTEVVDAEGAVMRAAASLPIGAVALTEECLFGDPYGAGEVERVRERVRRDLAALPFPLRPLVVGIGGTATTFAAVDRGLERYDGEVIHGSRVLRSTFERILSDLAAMTLVERRRVGGLQPQRAEVIAAGGIALLEIVVAAGADGLLVSDRGVRHGALLDRLSPSG